MPSPSEADARPPERHPPRSDPASGSPAAHEPRNAPAPGSPEEALRRLEQRLDQASEAAERLIAQVAAQAARAGAATRAGDSAADAANAVAEDADSGDHANGSPQPPPAGWQTPEEEPPPFAPELDPLVALLQAMRGLIPAELQQRLIAALRELLLAMRALIDWYLERMDHRREQRVEVQDIPIL